MEILNRYSKEVIYENKEISTMKELVEEAVEKGISLEFTNLSGSSLYGSDLSGTDLSGSDLYGSDLSGTNLINAKLSGSDLSGTDLSGSDLSGSDLYGVDLSGSSLYGSDLSGTNLINAKLSEIRGIEIITHSELEYKFIMIKSISQCQIGCKIHSFDEWIKEFNVDNNYISECEDRSSYEAIKVKFFELIREV